MVPTSRQAIRAASSSLACLLALAAWGCGERTEAAGPGPMGSGASTGAAGGSAGAAGSGAQAGAGANGGAAAGGQAGAGQGGSGGNPGSCAEEHPDHTIGLLRCTPSSFDGYTLFAPVAYETTYLVDIRGELVHQWDSSHIPGSTAYLLENGHLLRTAKVPGPAFPNLARGGRIEEYDWDGNLVWAYGYCDDERCQHHDVGRLPNGNVLLVAWEKHSRAEAIAAGRDPEAVGDNGLLTDTLVEIAPTGPSTGEVVWLWRAWDHVMQSFDPARDNFVAERAEHPGRLDINFPTEKKGVDWLHVNSVEYHPGFDQILFSSHNTSEIYVIDHSTATAHYGDPAAAIAAAAGPGGEVLYRWGNPAAYGRGTAAEQQLFGQHDPSWIELGLPGGGHILVYNNGFGRPEGEYSTLEEIVPPVDVTGSYALLPSSPYGPDAVSWHYQAPTPTDFYSRAQAGCQRLPNGNTLVAEAMAGRIFEVTAAGERVWEYRNPVTSLGPQPQGAILDRNRVARAYRYAPTYPGLVGRDLTPSGPLELP